MQHAFSPLFSFAPGARRWQRDRSDHGPLDLCDAVKLLTYNVLFSDLEAVPRRAAILDILATESADVVVLQEVTANFLAGLLASDFVRETYAVSTISLAKQDYDVVMLSALPATCDTLNFVSSMGRRLHTIRLLTADGSIVIAGTHLESSLDQRATRLVQLDASIAKLREFPTAIVLGDLNFEPGTPEHERLRTHGYADVWQTLEPLSPGYTRDRDRNAFAAGDAATSGRIDHVYLRSAHWSPTSIRLLGTEAIDEAGRVFPSDHFGLCATLAPAR